MYHGDSFYIQEFKAWIETEPKGAELRLKTSNLDSLQWRINNWCRKYGHTVETHKETDTILTLKLIWL